MDPHTQPPPTIITPSDPNRPQSTPYVAPVPAEPTITGPLDNIPLPTESAHSKKRLIGVLLIVAVLAGVGAYFGFMRNNDGSRGILGGDTAETVDNTPDGPTDSPDTGQPGSPNSGGGTPNKPVDPAVAEPMTTMMKAYTDAWKIDTVKALGYLDMAALKADPSCGGKCTDADITEPERVKYSESSSKIEAVTASDNNKVKVYLSSTDTESTEDFKGGYEYTLKANGTSYKITAIEVFFE